MQRKILFIIVYTFLFLNLIFVVDSYFFRTGETQHIENNFIEKSKPIEDNQDFNTPLTLEEKNLYKTLLLLQKQKLDSQKQEIVPEISEPIQKKELAYIISIIPTEIQEKLGVKKGDIETFLTDDVLEPKVNKLGVELYKKLNDVRGKFKNRAVKLFGVLDLPQSELFSVFVHEFGHYIDLYYLEQGVFQDLSVLYYDISWESTKVLKKGMKQSDFVSGYAMTNKYEDFAESFTYYVLHNGDFLQKAEKSELLTKKYNFFKDYIFENQEFQTQNFSLEKKVKTYYRDITKIPYDLEKFLQYLQK